MECVGGFLFSPRAETKNAPTLREIGAFSVKYFYAFSTKPALIAFTLTHVRLTAPDAVRTLIR